MLLRTSLALALLLSSMPLAHSEEKAENRVQNPSLEGALADTGLPEGWHGWFVGKPGYAASVVPGGHHGEKALLVEGDGKYGGVTTTKVPIEPGKRYRVRGWAKLEGAADAKALVKLDFMRPNGDYLGGVNMGELTAGEQGWQCLSAVSHADDVPGAEVVGVVVSLHGTGKAWFDDLELLVEDGPDPAGNLLANGTMEDTAGGRPAFWFLSTVPGARVTLGTSEEEPKEGKHSLCLKGKAPYAVAVGERYRAQPGKDFVLSGFVRVKSGQASVKIDYYHGDQYLGCTEAPPANTIAWQERSVTTDFAKYPNATHFAACLVAFGGNLDAYFDDVRLTAK